jgi:hypothetical protein
MGKESYLRDGDTIYRKWWDCELEKGNDVYSVVSGQANGFGGLVVSMLASISRVQTRPKPSDFGRKNPQHAFLRKGIKAVCPMSSICGVLKIPGFTCKLESQAKFVGHFSPDSFLRLQRPLMSLDVERLWRWRKELKAVHRGPLA